MPTAMKRAATLTLTDIPGVRVGHATDSRGLTGCTVILAGKSGFVAGCDIGGGASGTREMEPCRPGHVASRVHALLFAGGSAYGIAAADGVMRYLERRGIGHPTSAGVVPIVPTAILYDLAVGRATARPDSRMGIDACRAASARPVASGNVGAGTGATVGKLLGMRFAMRGGLGNAGVRMGEKRPGITVSALAVVNAVGDVRCPDTGEIMAGVRSATGRGFADAVRLLETGVARRSPLERTSGTTLVAIVTDALLTRPEACRIARRCQDALARTITPCHTQFDGDIVFVLSAGTRRADPERIAMAAGRACGLAIADGVRTAVSLRQVPSWRDRDPRS